MIGRRATTFQIAIVGGKFPVASHGVRRACHWNGQLRPTVNTRPACEFVPLA